MSFVYIDSQGREVNIPSVDAVRLRIELGAIKDQTRFFDENTGKWAPAAEHEIYRTLKRQLLEAEHGFVAPPPPAATPGTTRGAPSPSEVEPKAPAPSDGEGLEEESQEADGVTADADGFQDEAEPDVFAEVDGLLGQSDGGWDDVDEEVFDSPATDFASSDAGDAPPEFAGLGNVELLPTDEGSASGADEETGADAFDPEDPWADEEESDEGGPSIEDETAGADEEGGSRSDQSLFVTSAEDELMAGLDSDDVATQLEGGSLDLEPSLAESFPGPGETPPGTPAEPETPQSEAAELDSLWDSAEDHREEPEPSFTTAEELRAERDEGPAVDVPPRSSGSAPPQRKLTKARTPGAERIVGVVALVVALGAVGFFGWRFLAPALGGGGGEPEIVLPPLDQELLPRMRQLAGRASGRMAQDMLELPERAAVPGEPSQDWLAGIYLAGASQYPNVPDYWNAIGNWVDAARTAENALFREALRAQLDTANLAASDAEAIRDRALAGFQAAGSDRRIVYEQMREVSDRALVLHEFLLANEGQVEYEPAGSGVSRDPVLEAVPATEALGDEMWEMVGSITSAMDALGYLDRIDTERLLAVFLEKLDAVAIR